MELFGIGPLELLAILIIMLLVLGPEDMAKMGRTLGRLMRKTVKSEGWANFQKMTREVRTLPNKLMREAGLEELKELENLKKDVADIQQWQQGLGKELDVKGLIGGTPILIDTPPVDPPAQAEASESQQITDTEKPVPPQTSPPESV